MKHLDKSDRNQLKVSSLEELLSPDSDGRVIDCFLDFAIGSDLAFKVNKDSE